MIPFLQSIATELTARHASALSNYCIVLPHKRGVTYMRQYMEEALERVLLRNPHKSEMPTIITIAEQLQQITGLKAATPLQQQFLLFDTYRSLYGSQTGSAASDFEAFRAWGPTVIADFDDVDMADVPAAELYKNLVDYNSIRTDFLSDEQKEVIEKYFGVKDPGTHIKRFWAHVRAKSDVQNRFLSLWEKLYPLYTAYRELLLKAGLSYPGMATRIACERVQDGEYTFPFHKVVYVGFSIPSLIEQRLFSSVQALRTADGESMADFFWDTPGAALAESSPIDVAEMVQRMAKKYPCSIPHMDRYYESCKSFPQEMQEIPCPGNTAQAKVISALLSTIVQGKGKPYIDPARVAVVLPDEGLLFPVLHSVPASVVESANLTMGYPLRHTSVASFVALLRQMHSRARLYAGVVKYYGKDISALLSHPLSRAILGQQVANCIHGYMIDSHLYFVSVDDIGRALAEHDGPDADVLLKVQRLFAPLPRTDEVRDMCEHISASLSMAKQSVTDMQTQHGESIPLLQVAHIDRYLEVFAEFADLCDEYGVKMQSRTALSLASRLLSTESISMQGRSMAGLQIMGMLETRALDFDYLIIPSMNERIYPRRTRSHTFIPDALRVGYGIAATRMEQDMSAYHFYRLIARAKEVYMLYDASQGGLKSGDPSRYLLQLRYLFGPQTTLKRCPARFNVQSAKEHSAISVPKSEDAHRLRSFLKGGGKATLSASSLKDYISCPLKFYFSYILKKKVEDMPGEYMSAISIGNVLHESMQYIYDTLGGTLEHPAVVSAEQINSWLSSEAPIGEYEDIRQVATKFIRREYMPSAPAEAPLGGDATLMLEMLVQQIRWCLQADLSLAPFEYLASELKLPVTYRLPDGREVNMVMIIDRLDRITTPDGSRRLRIVDYKTGSDKTSFSGVSQLFSSSGEHKAIFQLMLYAHLLSQLRPDIASGPIVLSIYKSREMGVRGFSTTVELDGRPLYSHLPLVPEFEEKLREILTELFDEDIAFAPAPGLPASGSFTSACSYCPFKPLCQS